MITLTTGFYAAMFVGLLTVWAAIYTTFNKEVKDALESREEELEANPAMSEAEISRQLKPLRTTWIWFSWFFGISILCFFFLMLTDLTNLATVCAKLSTLVTDLLLSYGFVFLGLGLFETRHVKKFAEDPRYVPKVWFGHLAIYPIMAVVQGFAAYLLYVMVSLLSPTTTFTLYGWILFTALLIGFVSSARIIMDVREPNWEPSLRIRRRDAAIMLLWLSPWIVYIAENVLTSPVAFC